MPIAIAVLQSPLPLRPLPILRKILLIVTQVMVPLLDNDSIFGRVQIGPANLSITSILNI